jgi:uncharacterized repeat protein (TIGR01451 family)
VLTRANAVAEPSEDDNSAFVSTTVATAIAPDLYVNGAVTPHTVLAGGNLTYSLRVGNRGVAAASNVAFRKLPAGASFVSASATRGFTCHGSGEAVDCTGGSLPEGGEAAITIVAAAPETTGVAVNEATVDPDGAVTELEEKATTRFVSRLRSSPRCRISA